MVRRRSTFALGGLFVAAALSSACQSADEPTAPFLDRPAASAGSGSFDGIPSSTTCTVPGGNPSAPLVLPPGFTQTIIASEGPGFPDLADMITVNETGPQPFRHLYRTHETGSNGAVSVTDLLTGAKRIIAQRSDWERFDGIAWTPWGTIVAAEETGGASLLDPQFPGSLAGLVYEIDPGSGASFARPAVGSRSHEGLRFDGHGNFYGISETSPGYIYKFVPDTYGDLSSGQLYALKLAGGSVGAAEWVPLDRASVQVRSDPVAAAAGATGYSRPEDVEIAGGVLYVAITGENRVIGVDLGSRNGSDAFVFDFVRAGINVSSGFSSPDNLALGPGNTLYIAEDPGGNFPGKMTGDDVWAARIAARRGLSPDIRRFLSINDCDAEPTGIYFAPNGTDMFVNVQHRGGSGEDLTVRVSR